MPIYVIFCTIYATMAYVIGPFFMGNPMEAFIHLSQICKYAKKKCIFVQNYAIFCTFLHIFAQTMPLWHMSLDQFFIGNPMGAFMQLSHLCKYAKKCICVQIYVIFCRFCTFLHELCHYGTCYRTIFMENPMEQFMQLSHICK